jgi:hypothetical protein
MKWKWEGAARCGGEWREERRCGDATLVHLDDIISARYAAI